MFSKRDSRKVKWQWLSAVTIKQRLGIERVDMRWSSFHKQEDNPFCTNRKMRLLRYQRVAALSTLIGCGVRILREQSTERQMTESDGGTLEQTPSF